MKSYLECWISVAKSLFSQALAGEPELVETDGAKGNLPSGACFVASVTGDVAGTFTVALDPLVFQAPLLGDGVDQAAAWEEFLREVAEAASGELMASSKKQATISSFSSAHIAESATHTFHLKTAENSWLIAVRDAVTEPRVTSRNEVTKSSRPTATAGDSTISSGIELLLDVELEAALRFGCCEMPLGEILELGPGDVVELDRHITEPVDLVVGNKIVAKGEVVLVNGSFGLRVTEVAAPQKRLESIRCLF